MTQILGLELCVAVTSRTRSRVITEPGQRHLERRNHTDRIDCRPTTIEGRRTTQPKELVRQHEVAAWLGYIDPIHEAGHLIQRITKETLRATEAWTDGRHAEDDKHVELDYELAVGLQGQQTRLAQ